MSSTHTGGCLCGAVRYACEGDPDSMGICQCERCQRQSGSSFLIAMVYPRDKVRIAEGELASYTASIDGEAELTRHFCPRCGSAVMITLDRYPEIRSMMGGTFDDKRPSCAPPSVCGARADNPGSSSPTRSSNSRTIRTASSPRSAGTSLPARPPEQPFQPRHLSIEEHDDKGREVQDAHTRSFGSTLDHTHREEEPPEARDRGDTVHAEAKHHERSVAPFRRALAAGP